MDLMTSAAMLQEALAGVPADKLDGMIGEAVQSVRKHKNRERQGRTPS